MIDMMISWQKCVMVFKVATPFFPYTLDKPAMWAVFFLFRHCKLLQTQYTVAIMTVLPFLKILCFNHIHNTLCLIQTYHMSQCSLFPISLHFCTCSVLLRSSAVGAFPAFWGVLVLLKFDKNILSFRFCGVCPR